MNDNLEKMYLCEECEGDNLCAPVKDQEYDKMLYVFDGEFTCCRLGHPNNMPCDKTRIMEACLGMCAAPCPLPRLPPLCKSVLPHSANQFSALASPLTPGTLLSRLART